VKERFISCNERVWRVNTRSCLWYPEGHNRQAGSFLSVCEFRDVVVFKFDRGDRARLSLRRRFWIADCEFGISFRVTGNVILTALQSTICSGNRSFYIQKWRSTSLTAQFVAVEFTHPKSRGWLNWYTTKIWIWSSCITAVPASSCSALFPNFKLVSFWLAWLTISVIGSVGEGLLSSLKNHGIFFHHAITTHILA
jgi:hypothetical protein